MSGAFITEGLCLSNEINGAHASRSTRVALAKRANNHYGDHCGVAPPRLNEVEQELIKYASAARPLRGLRILLEGDAPPSMSQLKPRMPNGQAWRVVEVRTNTGFHTSYVGRGNYKPPAVD